MIKRIAHIGIAVEDIDHARRLYEALLNREASNVQHIEDQHVIVSSFHVERTNIELTAATDDNSPIARFIGKRGEGIHHISFEVDDIRAELTRLKAEGFQLIDEEPRIGADNYWVAFIHPKSTGGVLIELSQPIESTT